MQFIALYYITIALPGCFFSPDYKFSEVRDLLIPFSLYMIQCLPPKGFLLSVGEMNAWMHVSWNDLMQNDLQI